VNKTCVTSVVHGTDFQYYIPLFLYTLNVAYPEYDAQIFLTEELDAEVTKIVDTIKHDNNKILLNKFDVKCMRKNSSNALRHLIPEANLSGYKYWHPTDIDFLIFRQEMTHIDYYKHIMKKTCQPYAGARGPINGIRRLDVSPAGWVGDYQRIAAGCFAAKIPEWFDKTRKSREKYMKIFAEDTHDEYDNQKPGSYREYDEVMLFRIVRESNMVFPKKKDCFVYGKKMNAKYRSIHLGDFKFNKRWKNTERMKRILTQNNIEAFVRLEKDPKWLEISAACSSNTFVGDMLHRLRHHVRKRI